MSNRTDSQNEYTVQSVPVNKLYFFHPLEYDDGGILITAIANDKSENIIPLQFNYLDDFGSLRLRYVGTTFHNYFPPNASVKVSEMLLSRSTTKYKDKPDGNWNIRKIIAEKKDDCQYLFKKAAPNDYTVILGIKLEIIDSNNSSQQLILYRRDGNRRLLHCAVREKDMEMIKVLLNYKVNIDMKVKEGMTPLLVAVELDIPDVVDFLISNGADVNAQNDQHQSSLHFAVSKNNLKILDSLLKNQAKLDKEDIDGQTPLHYAVVGGNVNIVDILLKKGANYKLTDKLDRTPFHLAALHKRLDIIKFFLDNNVDADIINQCEQTPFFYLSENPIQPPAVDKEIYLKIIDAILKKGANINFQDTEGHTSLHYAVINDNIECMLALLGCNADITITNNSGKNVLHLASWYGANKCIQVLLNCNIDIDAVDDEERTALHLAVEKKNKYTVQLILKKKPNINVSDNSGKTALHIAIESRCLVIAELLLKNGANVDSKDVSGKTALYLAVESNDPAAVKFLLENRANVNLKYSIERTVLHVASQKRDIQIEIIKSILNSIDEIDARDNLKKTAIHYAALYQNVDILNCLLEKNFDINAKDFKGRTPLHVIMAWGTECVSRFECMKVLINHEADVNAVDNHMNTPLHLACLIKNVEAVKYLIGNGADSNMRDKDGKTVFHYACMNMDSLRTSCTRETEILKDLLNVLVEEEISINCGDKFGKTPLHYVVENDCESIMNELLLNIGADINAKDKDHRTVFDKLFEQINSIRSTGRIEQVAELYHQKIFKMKVLEKRFCERTSSNVYETTNVYEQNCSKEIDLMKTININESKITYYDFLKKRQHDVVNYVHNEKVVNAIKSNRLIAIFPIYGRVLKCHLREVQRRSHVYDKILKWSESYIFEKLPIDCLYEIFKYLNNSDLNMLVEAFQLVVLVK